MDLTGGVRTLTVSSAGSTLSGLVSNGGLTKAGAAGTLTLSRAAGNTYAGGTIISEGKLLVTNTSGSGTGTGSVTVDAGGTGIVSGPTTVSGLITGGDTTGIGTISITNTLALTATGAYSAQINSTTATADKMIVNGLSLGVGSLLNVSDLGVAALAAGTSFTLIDNTSAGAINGTFSNVAEGGTLTAGANQFQFTYLGGTGNDFVATVVPEPGVTLLGLLGVLGLLRRRWI